MLLAKLEELWKKLSRHKISNDELCYLIVRIKIKSIREKVARRLLNQEPSNEDLLCIILYVESLRPKAWKELLKRRLTNDDLCCIIENVESLREVAWKKLLKRGKIRE